MRAFLATLALFAASAFTSDAIYVNQTYSTLSVKATIHALYDNDANMKDFAQLIYNTAVLPKVADHNLTVFFPVNGQVPPFDHNSSLANTLLTSYHFVNQSIAPTNETTKDIVASTFLISPNSVTKMSNGTSQKLLVSFTADSVIADYGHEQRAHGNVVYNCSNGFIYMIDAPLAFPLKPTIALANLSSTSSISFGSGNVSDYLNDLEDVTFFTTNDASYTTIDQVNNQVVHSILYMPDFTSGTSYATLGSQNITVQSSSNSSYTANDVRISRSIPVWNGVVQILTTKNSTPISNNTVTVVDNTTTAGAGAVLSASAFVVAAAGSFAALMQF